MKVLRLFLWPLFLLFGTFPALASSFSLKGLYVGMSESELVARTGMKCSSDTEDGAVFDKTCATDNTPPEAFATFAGYPVRLWGAQVDDGRVVGIFAFLVGAEQPALLASLEAKHGKATASRNPMASSVWEASGERLSMGSARSGDRLISLWSIAAFDRMVHLRSRAIQNDM